MDRIDAGCYDCVVREVVGNQLEILVRVVALIPGLLTAGCYYSGSPIAMRCDPGNDRACPSGMTCSAQGVCESGDGTDASAGSDAGSTGSDADTCFGAAPFRICLAAAPTMPLTISQLRTIDTADLANCVDTVSGGNVGCVMAATTITVEATLRSTGPRPLVLIASDSISIKAGGLIDVGSHRGVAPELGAGADPQDCVPGKLANEGGGGAGGSFVGLGGNGAASDVFPSIAGGTPGPSITAPITRLRGGCAGQDTPGSNGVPVRGGHGGGAVLLIAGRAITLTGGAIPLTDGAINAAGEGGEGGSSGAGGGGGGAGGMIGLDAPTIASSGLVLASGAGGGGGSSGGSGSAGPGKPGAGPSAVPAATGGAGGPDGGGRGGDGPSSAATAGGSAGSNGGFGKDGGVGNGGGGGGGTGLVKAPATASLGLQVSPRQTP
jgi:hypothetical protein